MLKASAIIPLWKIAFMYVHDFPHTVRKGEKGNIQSSFPNYNIQGVSQPFILWR